MTPARPQPGPLSRAPRSCLPPPTAPSAPPLGCSVASLVRCGPKQTPAHPYLRAGLPCPLRSPQTRVTHPSHLTGNPSRNLAGSPFDMQPNARPFPPSPRQPPWPQPLSFPAFQPASLLSALILSAASPLCSQRDPAGRPFSSPACPHRLLLPACLPQGLCTALPGPSVWKALSPGGHEAPRLPCGGAFLGSPV